MNLGQYLVSREFNDCITLSLDTGRWQVTRFNPNPILPDFYIIDGTGRAQPNPAYHEAHMLRYGFDERRINGTKVGERLPDFLSEITPWMDRLGIEKATRQLQDRKDLLYVSNGGVPALDTLIHEMRNPGEVTESTPEEIEKLSRKVDELNTKLGNLKIDIKGVIESIDDLDFPARGGGKWVSELKSVRSSLQSLL